MMAKRFINTEIFSDTWFMDLPQKYKLFWMILITKCSHAGLWQVNFREASFYIGSLIFFIFYRQWFEMNLEGHLVVKFLILFACIDSSP